MKVGVWNGGYWMGCTSVASLAFQLILKHGEIGVVRFLNQTPGELSVGYKEKEQHQHLETTSCSMYMKLIITSTLLRRSRLKVFLFL